MKKASVGLLVLAIAFLGLLTYQPALSVAEEAAKAPVAEPAAPAEEAIVAVDSMADPMAEEKSDSVILKEAAAKLRGIDDKLADEVERIAKEYEEDFEF